MHCISMRMLPWAHLYWASVLFQVADYENELEEMKHMTRQEFVASLRRYI